ncbi:hypothetical protein [Bdellovibrio sp. GT3]|uniref:hypothetical protein n=1 Tax=Bdellovibrio sp. GT3 TaxID=3136282 RepID=UPI0030EFC68F
MKRKNKALLAMLSVGAGLSFLFTNATTGEITGYVDGVKVEGSDFVVYGWACDKSVQKSIDVHLYVGGSAGSGTGITGVTANFANEDAVNNLCQTTRKIAHRFNIRVPLSRVSSIADKSIYVHGISASNGSNLLLLNSGKFRLSGSTGKVSVLSSQIKGFIEAPTRSGSTLIVKGWACDRSVPKSNSVHLYFGGPAGSGTFIANIYTTEASDAAVANACQTAGKIAHRFTFQIPASRYNSFPDKAIYIHGISESNGPHLLITNSGNYRTPGIAGKVESMPGSGGGYKVQGWSCDTYAKSSNYVHVYVGGPAGPGRFLGSALANLSKNTATSKFCKTSGLGHRYSFNISAEQAKEFNGQAIYVHGLSTTGGENPLLTGSGKFKLPTMAMSKTGIAPANNCSSSSICVHSKMPLLSQIDTSNGKVLQGTTWVKSYGSNASNADARMNQTALGFDKGLYNMGLLEFINLRYGLSLRWDTGWCGGVAMAMSVKGRAVEQGLGSSNHVNEFLVSILQAARTGIKNGGTSYDNLLRGLKSIDGSSSYVAIPSAGSFFQLRTFNLLNVNNKYGGHTIAVNGNDGPYMKIYDPWGRVYDVTIAGTSIGYAKGSAGYISKSTPGVIAGSYKLGR